MHGYLLNPDERVVRVFLQSKLVLIKPFLIAGLAFGIPWWYLLHYDLTSVRSAILVWSVVCLLYFVREYRLWTLQKYVITSKRLIKLQHEALFKKVVVETPLERILNVSFKTTGLFSVIGRYGDVEVQVVGLIDPIVLKNITRPASIKEYLWHAHEQAAKDTKFDAVHLQEKIGYTKENQKIL